MGQTLFEKIWNAHVVAPRRGRARPPLHRPPPRPRGDLAAGVRVAAPRRAAGAAAGADARDDGPQRPDRRRHARSIRSREQQLDALARNCAEFGVPLYATGSGREGIVHVIGPELGLTQPGMTIVCGDSHTSTHGAFGALAFGIGTSEVEHVLATQTLPQRSRRRCGSRFDGEPAPGVTAKDYVLSAIGVLGVVGRRRSRDRVRRAGDRGALDGGPPHDLQHVDRGRRARRLDRAGRHHVRLPARPAGRARRLRRGRRALARAATRTTDAVFDRELEIDVSEIRPQVTWGTNPGHGRVDRRRRARSRRFDDPTTARLRSARSPTWRSSPARRSATSRSSACSSARARTRASRICAPPPTVVDGQHVHPSVRAMVVPGSAQVKQQAEAEGLDRVFTAAGFEWRRAGCSMCLGMNPDVLSPGERCASTSNRNFEGRQGAGGRTHLVSRRRSLPRPRSPGTSRRRATSWRYRHEGVSRR